MGTSIVFKENTTLPVEDGVFGALECVKEDGYDLNDIKAVRVVKGGNNVQLGDRPYVDELREDQYAIIVKLHGYNQKSTVNNRD